MTENIARIVNAVLDADAPAVAEPASIITDRLIRTLNELDGARFDDVYPNVLAWVLSRDRS